MGAEASALRTVLAALLALGVLALWSPAARWADADRAVARSPDRALSKVPQHPKALELAAVRALEAGDDARAESLAKQAIAKRPLEGRPYRILAALYERSGRLAEARAAHLAAIAVSPSDAVSRLWIASRLLSESQFPDALAHIDRALRARPDFRAAVFPVLVEGLANPSFVDALVDSLNSDPPWRLDFLGHIVQTPQVLDLALPVFAALSEREPMPAGEQRLLIGAYERAARWDDLSAAWQRLIEQPSDTPRFLVDGGFEHDPQGFGLGWRIDRVPGALVGFAPAGGSANGGRALTIRFLDQRVPFAHVRQRLLLPEGDYRLSGESRADGLRTRRGVRWELACDGRSELLAAGPLTVGTQHWQRWAVDFSIPSGCPSQWLVLRLAAVGPSEQMVGGAVAFDGLQIAPIEAHTGPDVPGR
jgi:hypothetical protein